MTLCRSLCEILLRLLTSHKTKFPEKKTKLHSTSGSVFCAIWYHLYNLKIVKNTHGGVIIVQMESNCVKTSQMYYVFEMMNSALMKNFEEQVSLAEL